MLKVFEDILKIKYSTMPESGNKGHEQSVANILKQHGFIETKKIPKKKFVIERDLLPNRFVHQPNGSQKSPDFIVNYNDKYIHIECKSSKDTTAPTYNGGMPNSEYVYVFTSGNTDETTIFYGDAVAPEEIQEILNELIKEIAPIVNKYNQKLAEHVLNNYGINYYCRNMFDHRGNTQNYFTHPIRKKEEQRVLNTFRELSRSS